MLTIFHCGLKCHVVDFVFLGVPILVDKVSKVLIVDEETQVFVETAAELESCLEKEIWYSRTPKCGHPEIRTSCFIRTLYFVPMQ